jgi:hypothetical protein
MTADDDKNQIEMDKIAPATDPMCCDEADKLSCCLPCTKEQDVPQKSSEDTKSSVLPTNGDLTMQDCDSTPEITVGTSKPSDNSSQASELSTDVVEEHQAGCDDMSRASSSESSSKLLEPTQRRPFKPSSSKRQQLIAKEAVEIYLLRPKTKAGKLLRRGSMAHCKVRSPCAPHRCTFTK